MVMLQVCFREAKHKWPEVTNYSLNFMMLVCQEGWSFIPVNKLHSMPPLRSVTILARKFLCFLEMNGLSAVIDLVPCTELVADEFFPDQPGH